MQRMIMIGVLVLVLASCGGAAEPPTLTAEPPNITFVFRQRDCGVTDMNVFDSASGLLVHTPLGTTRSITLALELSQRELAIIQQQITAMDFFSYPAELRVELADNQMRVIRTPAPTYSIRVTNGTQTHSVTWTDDIVEPKQDRVERFRVLVDLIQRTLNAHPAMHQLPEPRAACG